MNIKGKILAIVIAFLLLISFIAGSVIRNYVKAREQVHVVGVTLDVLAALMQTHLAMISQISLSMDYVLTGQAREKRDQQELKAIARDSFREWAGAIDRYISLVPGEQEEKDRFLRVEEEYAALDSVIELALSFAERGKQDEAYDLLEDAEFEHTVEIMLANEFAQAEIKERREFEESYETLVKRAGLIPLTKAEEAAELKHARFLFHDFLAANKVYVNILKQYRELIDYLVSAEEVEKEEFFEYGVLAAASFNEWNAVQDTFADPASHDMGLFEERIGTLRQGYSRFQGIAVKAIRLKEQGDSAAALAMERRLPALHESFFAMFLSEIRGAQESINAAYLNVLDNVYSAGKRAIFLVITVGITVLGIMIALMRSIFRPLTMLQQGTEIIGQGRFDYRIALGRNDELGQLSASFDKMAASLERDSARRSELETQLENSESRLRLLSTHILNVQEQERVRISHELHDDLGQSLSLQKLQLNALERNMGETGQQFRNEFAGLTDSLDCIIDNTRRISRELNPSILEDLGFTTAVRRLLEDFANHYETRCRFEIEEVDELLGSRTQLVIYRILQESLTNIVKHSHANDVSCHIRRNHRAVHIALEDNGVGFDKDMLSLTEKSGRGMGLMTMTERARMIGATLTIDAGDGRGTRLDLTIPAKGGEKV